MLVSFVPKLDMKRVNSKHKTLLYFNIFGFLWTPKLLLVKGHLQNCGCCTRIWLGQYSVAIKFSTPV